MKGPKTNHLRAKQEQQQILRRHCQHLTRQLIYQLLVQLGWSRSLQLPTVLHEPPEQMLLQLLLLFPHRDRLADPALLHLAEHLLLLLSFVRPYIHVPDQPLQEAQTQSEVCQSRKVFQSSREAQHRRSHLRRHFLRNCRLHDHARYLHVLETQQEHIDIQLNLKNCY